MREAIYIILGGYHLLIVLGYLVFSLVVLEFRMPNDLFFLVYRLMLGILIMSGILAFMVEYISKK